jgi:hypothetical protein
MDCAFTPGKNFSQKALSASESVDDRRFAGSVQSTAEEAERNNEGYAMISW